MHSNSSNEINLTAVLENSRIINTRPTSLTTKQTQWLILTIFDIGIPILGTLIWACPNSITGKVKTKKKRNTRFNFLGHVIDINYKIKKANKTKAHYCMYCLPYGKVVICLKRTEVFWLVKKTYYIIMRPYLRCIT